MAAYTTIDDPSAHFQTALWSGSDGTQSITFDGNSDMQPDWVWTKGRTIGFNHALMDSSRGVGSSGKVIVSNSGNAEFSINDYVMTLDSDGFGVGAGDAGFNASNDTYVSWCWKANGGTTSSNTDGNSTTTVQANTTAGFSIVTGSFTGSTQTYGHGLGVAPDVVLWKNRSNTNSWLLFTTAVDGSHDYGILNQGNNFSATSYDVPTSTVFYGNDDASTNFVAYCFAQKQGFSKFGSYTGNGDATNGPFIYTGFSPAWVMIKNTETTNRPWYMFDNKRRTFNANGLFLRANTADVEANDQAIDMLSNGFVVRPDALGSYGTSSLNHSGQKMLYIAFAENPFTTSTGIPTTAR
tara:strand:- start:700 stop:1755 length:1056 start_codon:yes stop_codon:yes gene_type:complete